jgi:hypothetical protein
MATTFTARSAHLAKVNRNTGTHASPTWVLWSAARDISTNSLKRDMLEVGDRSRIYKGNIRGRAEHSLVIQAPVNSADANFSAVWTAFHAADDDDAAVVYLGVTSADITTTGSRGIKGPYVVAEISTPYPIDGVEFADITFAPAAGAVDMTAVTIA